jgi:predicted nucleic acid-binding protein
VRLWLVDASVLLACEDSDDIHHDDATRLLRGEDAITTLDLAQYEIANVAVVAWKDTMAARRLRGLIAAVADDGGVVRANASLIEQAEDLASTRGLSVYDAAYVAAAKVSGAELVSCDLRDLVSKGLARTPGEALAAISLTFHQLRSTSNPLPVEA